MTHADKLRWVGDQLDTDASNKGIGQGSEGARYCWAAATEIERLQADREKLLKLLESASEVIGRFVSDEGWAQSDMDMMDAIDAEIVRMRRGY